MKVHIGREIERKFQESGLKIGVFAERINTGERNVYSLFKRQDIGVDMLTNISKVLGYNFFELYEKNLPESITSGLEGDYLKSQENIATSLTIVGKPDNYQNFPELLKSVITEARRLGFSIG